MNSTYNELIIEANIIFVNDYISLDNIIFAVVK